MKLRQHETADKLLNLKSGRPRFSSYLRQCSVTLRKQDNIELQSGKNSTSQGGCEDQVIWHIKLFANLKELYKWDNITFSYEEKPL